MSLTAAQQVGVLFAAQGVSEAGQAYSDYQATRAETIYNQNIYEMDARLANIRAGDVLRRGQREELGVNRQTRLLKGTQRAGFSAQGVETDLGTPGQVQAETEAFGALDAMKVRNNAIREAYGFKSQAIASEGKARLESITGKARARQTILTGAQRTLLFASLASRSKGFNPRNPTERRFDREYRRNR